MTLLEYAFLRNVWLWFHMLAGAILAKAWMGGWLFFGQVPDFVAVRNVFFLAIAWELVEYVWIRFVRRSLEQIYGEPKYFFMDAFGDVMGALFLAIVVAV